MATGVTLLTGAAGLAFVAWRRQLSRFDPAAVSTRLDPGHDLPLRLRLMSGFSAYVWLLRCRRSPGFHVRLRHPIVAVLARLGAGGRGADGARGDAAVVIVGAVAVIIRHAARTPSSSRRGGGLGCEKARGTLHA